MALKEHVWALGGLGLIGLAAFGIYALGMEAGNLETEWLVMGLAALVAVAGWVVVDHPRISQFLNARSTRQAGGGMGMVGLGLALAIGLNLVANQHDARIDLSSAKRFALAPQSVSVLKALEADVEVRAFFSGDSVEKSAFTDLIDGTKSHTRFLKLQEFDPGIHPIAADKNSVDNQMGTVILAMGDATQRLEADLSEAAFTNALIRLTSNVEHTICSTQGHGEIDIDDDLNPASISAMVTKLEHQNYTFKRVNLMRLGGVPSDCDLLLIPDPRVDFLAMEREHLVNFNAAGGRMLVLLEPGHSNGLAIHMAQYGIDVGENMVLENNPNYTVMGGDASTLVIGQNQMTDHPIMAPIVGMVLLRVARTVQAFQPPIEGFDVGELMLTSEFAWAESRIDGTTPPKPDLGEDMMGKMGLAAVSVADSGGIVLVFGDADFSSNELLDQGSNFDLLPNAIAWLVGETDQVSIRANPAARGLFTLNGAQGLMVWLVSLLVLPGITVGGAVATWIARRKR